MFSKRGFTLFDLLTNVSWTVNRWIVRYLNSKFGSFMSKTGSRSFFCLLWNMMYFYWWLHNYTTKIQIVIIAVVLKTVVVQMAALKLFRRRAHFNTVRTLSSGCCEHSINVNIYRAHHCRNTGSLHLCATTPTCLVMSLLTNCEIIGRNVQVSDKGNLRTDYELKPVYAIH